MDSVTPSSIATIPHTPDDLVPTLRGVPVSEPVTYRSLYVLEPLADWLAAQGGTASTAAAPEGRKELTAAGLLDPFAADVTGLENEPCVGALLTHRQDWQQVGLGLGNLLHSVCLAPGEVTRIAVVDWQRRTSGSSSEGATQDESVSSDIAQGRSVTEAQHATADELQKGGSMAATSSVTAQAAAGGGGLLFSASGSTSSNASAAMTAQFSAGRRELEASSSNQVAQTTAEKSKSVRSRRATVVKEVSEREAETTTTRILANYNRRHALNVEYFEVVMLYGTRTRLAEWQRCLFVPLQPLDFADPDVLKARLRDLKALMTPEAGAQLEAEARAYAAFKKQPKPPGEDTVRAVEALEAQAKRREGAARGLADFVPRLREGGQLGHRAFDAQQRFLKLQEAAQAAFGRGGGLASAPAQAEAEKARNAMGDAIAAASRLFERLGNDFWQFYGGVGADILSPTVLPPLLAPCAQHFGAVTQMVSALGSYGAGDEARAAFDKMVGELAEALRGVATDLQTQAEALRKEQKERLKGAGAPETYIPETPHPLIDALVADSLLWSQQVWLRADPARLHQMLAAHTVNGRAIGGLIDPHPVGVFGNFLAFRWGFARDEEGQRERDAFARRYIREDANAEPAAVEATVAVPTTGVFAEAVLGRGEAAEERRAEIYGEWANAVPPILPPDIDKIVSRDRDKTLDLSVKDFASALAALRATELRDFSHVHDLLGAVGKGDTFRDMGGLDQASAMLMKANELTAAGATAMAQEVSKLQAQAQKFVVDALNTPAVQDALKAVIPGLLPASAATSALGGAPGGAANAAASGAPTPPAKVETAGEATPAEATKS